MVLVSGLSVVAPSCVLVCCGVPVVPVSPCAVGPAGVFSWFLLSVEPGVPPAAGLSGAEAVSSAKTDPEKATKAEIAITAEVLRRFFMSS